MWIIPLQIRCGGFLRVLPRFRYLLWAEFRLCLLYFAVRAVVCQAYAQIVEAVLSFAGKGVHVVISDPFYSVQIVRICQIVTQRYFQVHTRFQLGLESDAKRNNGHYVRISLLQIHGSAYTGIITPGNSQFLSITPAGTGFHGSIQICA